MKRDELEALLAQAGERQFPPGHVLIAEGEIPEHVFVIISGRVRVIEAMPDAQTEVVLGELGPGEIVGELGILTERPRSATVVVLERTRCLALRRFHFLQALERSPALALGLAKLLARRLYDSDRRIARYAPDALTGLASRRGRNVPIKCRVGTAYREVPPDSSDELLREADEDMRRRGVTLPA